MSVKKNKYRGKLKNKRTQHPRCIGREWAFQFLFQLDLTADSQDFENSFKLFKEQLEENPTRPKDSVFEPGLEFCNELCSGVVKHLEELDKMIVKYAKNWTIDRMPIVDRNLLRMSFFELNFIEETPKVVAINEAVQLAKTYSEADSPKFINGLLDKFYQECLAEEAK